VWDRTRVFKHRSSAPRIEKWGPKETSAAILMIAWVSMHKVWLAIILDLLYDVAVIRSMPRKIPWELIGIRFESSDHVGKQPTRLGTCEAEIRFINS
jgi:hypothetical protein